MKELGLSQALLRRVTDTGYDDIPAAIQTQKRSLASDICCRLEHSLGCVEYPMGEGALRRKFFHCAALRTGNAGGALQRHSPARGAGGRQAAL